MSTWTNRPQPGYAGSGGGRDGGRRRRPRSGPVSAGQAGEPAGPGTCAPNSCSTHSTWPSNNAARAPSSPTPSRAASPPPSPSVNAAGDGAWSRRWARSGSASTTPWPRASSPPSNANCSTARTSTTTTKRAEPSSSSSRDGITPIVVTGAWVSNPPSPSRGATRKLHETQALNRPLKRGNSSSRAGSSPSLILVIGQTGDLVKHRPASASPPPAPPPPRPGYGRPGRRWPPPRRGAASRGPVRG